MLKVISLMKRKHGLSYEEFKKWALEEHPELGKKLPGLRHYRMSVVNIDSLDVPYDAVSELWFDDEAARQAAFATEEGKAAAADAQEHCSIRTHLLTEEKIIIE